jgi:Ca-activated chloride channel family protein
MTFIWPPVLLLLLLIPLGIWLYRSRERKRAARAAAFGVAPPPEATASSMPPVVPRTWSRRLPAALTVLGMTVLVFSLARPQSVIGIPRLEGTVLLAFDVSGSMAATDVEPSRMEAAKAAALEFIANQPSSVKIGVVVFSDSGLSTQAPTNDRAAIEQAIRRLEPERGTSLGAGIESALGVLEDALAPSDTDYYTNETAPRPDPTPVPDGVFEPAMIVVLSDGENTSDPDPSGPSRIAAERGIRIDTVGFGTAEGVPLEVEGFMVHTRLEEATLRAIADRTQGTYHPAGSELDLSAIYDDVGARLTVRAEPFELTPLLAALGFGLLTLGGLLSLRWFGRVP